MRLLFVTFCIVHIFLHLFPAVIFDNLLQGLGRAFCQMGHFQLFSMILKFSMGHFLSFYTDFFGPFSKSMGLWRMAPCLPNHCCCEICKTLSYICIEVNDKHRVCPQSVTAQNTDCFGLYRNRQLRRDVTPTSRIVFAHADVTPPVGPPYWITASGLYPLLPCKLAKFSNWFINLKNGILVWDFDYLLEALSYLNFQWTQCFRLASAIGHWPIKSENGLF